MKQAEKRRMVVVSDDPFQLKVISALLMEEDLDVSTFESVQDAFAGMSPDYPPDVIITDLHMPGIDGWRFCRLLRSQDYAAFNTVPILVVSATFSGIDAEEITADLGADAFLGLPSEPAVFKSYIQTLLKGEKPKVVKKVLMVDNDPAVANHLKRAFAKEGFDTYIAGSGDEARRLFKLQQPDICILDHHLPDLLGDELLIEFKAMAPRSVCIMITSDSSPELAIGFAQKGADSYMRKPFDVACLIELCQKAQRARSLLQIENLFAVGTRELRESEERYRSISRSLAIPVQGYDESRRVFYWNKASELLYGYTREEAIGRKLEDLIIPESMREEVKELVHRWMTEGQVIPASEVVLRHKDGRDVHVFSYHAMYESHDGNKEMFCIDVDLADQKAMEKEKTKLEAQFFQAQKMESVGRLAGGVAHDFNNLLTGITGNVYLAQMGLNSDDPLSETLTEVSEAAKRAADLTRQLLAFSRKQIIKPKVINLNELMGNMHKMLGCIIGEDIEIKTVTMKRLGRIKADPGQVEQIIVNLAVNARDAMPNGGKLTIETGNVILDENYFREHPFIVPGKYVMLAMSDNGEGMTEEVQRNIFDPFFTTKREGKGTGLGLSTVYGIVKQHSGYVEVYSEIGKGTSFKVYFPMVLEKTESINKKSDSDTLPKGTETVLIVEDEPMVRSIATKILKRFGYNVLSAADGGNAFVTIKKHGIPVDLLLTDVVMPNMNGRDVAKELRKLYPEMKVLFTSGYTNEVVVHHGVLNEGLEFIGKPYTPKALAVKVREVLDG